MHIPEIDQPNVDDGIAGVDYLLKGIRKIIVKVLKNWHDPLKSIKNDEKWYQYWYGPFDMEF